MGDLEIEVEVEVEVEVEGRDLAPFVILSVYSFWNFYNKSRVI